MVSYLMMKFQVGTECSVEIRGWIPKIIMYVGSRVVLCVCGIKGSIMCVWDQG